MSNDITFILVSFGHKRCQIDCIINSLLCQTDPGWKAIIVHDGPNDEVRSWVEAFNDPRLKYLESQTRTGFWGHYNRRMVMENYVDTLYMTWGNCDNYYTPVYVDWLKQMLVQKNLDIVVTNILHHYPFVNGPSDPPYSVLDARFGLNGVDFISYVVKTDLAKMVGLNHPEFTGADGMFIEDLKAKFNEMGRELRWDKSTSSLAVQN